MTSKSELAVKIRGVQHFSGNGKAHKSRQQKCICGLRLRSGRRGKREGRNGDGQAERAEIEEGGLLSRATR